MKGRRTAKEINEQKWRRMRLILDKLKEKPMSTVEIEQLVCGRPSADKIVKRSVQNYLAELSALGFVFLNPEVGVYELTENKKVFQSKHDYDIALKHSKNLIFSTSMKQRLDSMNPFLALDLIVFNDTNANQDIDDVCLFQHFQSGYSEVCMLMQKYRKLMDKMGLSKVPHFPKTNGDWSAANPDELVKSVPSLINNNMRDTHVESEISQEEDMFSFDFRNGQRLDRTLYSKEERERVKGLYHVRDLLVGKIYSIANDVQNGIPLQGFCDYCPDRKIIIKTRP